MANGEQSSAAPLKRLSSHYSSQSPAYYLRLIKGKNIRPGLQIISLHTLLQRFRMRQTKQRDYHNPTDTYYNTQFSAVEIPLDNIPANMVSCRTFCRESTINNQPMQATRPLILYVNCNSMFLWTILISKKCSETAD